MIDYNPNLSKDDKAFIIKMSAVALISALGVELIKFGMEGVRSLFKKKDATPVPAADPASKTEIPKTEGTEEKRNHEHSHLGQS